MNKKSGSNSMPRWVKVFLIFTIILVLGGIIMKIKIGGVSHSPRSGIIRHGGQQQQPEHGRQQP